MFLTPLELTQASLPEYLPDEVLLLIQGEVGLYQGKFKLPSQQNGKVYLTSHRICYVDNADAKKNSLAIALKGVERYDFYSGFLRSSPKVILYLKLTRNRGAVHSNRIGSPARMGASSPVNRSDSPYIPPIEAPSVNSATWVCTICSFSNTVPRGFDPKTATIHTPLDPCKACGIKPTLAHVLKATITNATGRQALGSPISSPRPSSIAGTPLSAGSAQGTPIMSPTPSAFLQQGSTNEDGKFNCPRCTFSNHPSLLNCEVCGAPLVSDNLPAGLGQASARTESPGPTLSSPTGKPVGPTYNEDSREPIKISFRGGNGGEKIFYERFKSAMVQRKWIAGGAPPVPGANVSAETYAPDGTASPQPAGQQRVRAAGVAGLEQRVGNQRSYNERAIGTAFEDLQSLMASAKDIIALAENFARQTNGTGSEASLAAESATQLGIVATKDITGGSNSESLYLSELSRNIAEYLMDDSRSVLKKAGGIITLVDLWAMFNRARGGVELVSPHDFEKASRMWGKLRLPIRLRKFKSGVLVVQGKDRTDESTIKAIQSWMRDLHCVPPDPDVSWDWQEFGRGVTAQEVGERFGWSIGVAEEELEMAEERGVLCREAGVEGVKFWENYIDRGEYKRKKVLSREDQIYKALKETGLV
ncbi:eap30 vps36 family protein [Zalerion maritima]|uniref:Vacuolar protein-sorting-associated protein 36 n=1 Tax=Zalerion maritima TaxID=339359 RepID=A0AAD5WYT6_9PEZI|nr:eap30 vps36 family protein [Zalerion maritima]